ncbi:MAG: DUF2085 domain-containing protein [bacterium]
MGLSFWISLIFFEIFLKYVPNLVILLPFLKKSLSLVCHQNENKLIDVCGINSLVCIRCSGLYLGAWFGSFLLFFIPFLFKKINKMYFFTALMLMVFDVFFITINLYIYNKLLSFFSGMFLGVVCFLYLYKSLFEYYAVNNNDD